MSPKLWVFMLFWRVLWFVGTPFVLLYLWNRGRKDSDYFTNIGQRFGFHTARERGHVWIHAVSLGELRSAVPIIREFLARGEQVVTTHFTPAGLREANRIFADEILQGKLFATWIPFDHKRAFNRFFRAFRPKLGLVMEVEFWPGMIFSARDSDIPLFLCNGQYPGPSFERDKSRFLSPALFVPGFAGVMVKSQEQADRFRALGVEKIAITGEMRFDQPIPEAQALAASNLRDQLEGHEVIGFCNMTADEESMTCQTVVELVEGAKQSGKTPQLIVVVPRAPERFAPFAERLEEARLRVSRRSECLSPSLGPDPKHDLGSADVLFGDSLGEMFFYQSLCDRVVIGGGFTPAGSHNIIEPISLGKPVYVGPEIWTIEFPAREAINAGICIQLDPSELAETVRDPHPASDAEIMAFFNTFGGSVPKTIKALESWGAH